LHRRSLQVLFSLVFTHLGGRRTSAVEQDNRQPYEGLDCNAQERALQAAAAVIAALQDGTITGHGTAAHLFRPTTDSGA